MPARAIVGRVLCVAVACACIGVSVEVAGARATVYVDGISDQSLPSWDGAFGGYFTQIFKSVWLGAGHVRYARFVMPWYEGSSGNDAAYRSWCADAGRIGLTLDLSLTSYREAERRPAPGVYRAALEALLEQCPAVSIVEPWNEPDNGGESANGEASATYVNPSTAAAYADEAASLCRVRGCVTVVGNLLDSDPDMVGYEQQYARALGSATFPDWGMHPYLAVQDESPRTVTEFESNWGAGARSLWFTEVGAYDCRDFATVEVAGEASQAEHAEWLVRTLLPAIRPEHAFYYELLDGDGRPPQGECENNRGRPDTALYVPSTDPNARDRPRPAAAWILADAGTPWSYTGTALGVGPDAVTLTGTVYPGGKLAASYHFEYWPSDGVPSYSPEARSGAGETVTAASALLELAPATHYNYRLIAWNAEGARSGAEHSFTTAGAEEAFVGRGLAAGYYYEFW